MDTILVQPEVENVRESQVGLCRLPHQVPGVGRILLELVWRNPDVAEVLTRLQVLLIAAKTKESLQVRDHNAASHELKRAASVRDYRDGCLPVLTDANDIEVDELALERHGEIAHRHHACRVVKHAKFGILLGYQSFAEWHKEDLAVAQLSSPELALDTLADPGTVQVAQGIVADRLHFLKSNTCEGVMRLTRSS